MNLLMNFLTILAWIGAVVGGLMFFLGCYNILKYEGSTEQKLDQLRGTRVSWPRQKWFTLVFVISTVFLIAKAMS